MYTLVNTMLWTASTLKILVAYTSRTGNTKKVAEAIYEEIEEEKGIKKFDDVKNLDTILF